MKNLLLAILVVSIHTNLYAQTSDSAVFAQSMQFMREGDYENSALLLQRLHSANTANFEYLKQYTFVSYLRKDYAKGLELSKNLLLSPKVDVNCFQIVANIHSALGDNKQVEKTLKKGLEKFPASGLLNSELGEYYALDGKPTQAIQLWEKGIVAEPRVASNYFFAAQYFAQFNEPVKAMIYAETFINIEKLTERTTTARNILLNAYKKVLVPVTDKTTGYTAETDLYNAIGTQIQKNAYATMQGITAATLHNLRTEFLQQWVEGNFASKYGKVPIFSFWQELQKANLFEAYNQWVLGSTNAASYAAWVAKNKTLNDDFFKFYRNHIFKPNVK